MPRTFPLTKTLNSHDGPLTELTLRDLTAVDIVSARVPPVRLIEVKDGENHAEVRYDVVMSLLSKMTGIDDIVLGGLSAKDFHVATKEVLAVWNAAGE